MELELTRAEVESRKEDGASWRDWLKLSDALAAAENRANVTTAREEYLAQLQARVAELEAECGNWKDRFRVADEQRISFHRQLDEEIEKGAAQARHVAELELERKDWKRNWELEAARANGAEMKIAELQKAIAERDRTVADLEWKVGDRGVQIDRLEKMVAALKREKAERDKRDYRLAGRILSLSVGGTVRAGLATKLAEIAAELSPPEPAKPDPHPWLTRLRTMKDEAMLAENYERAAALRDAMFILYSLRAAEPPDDAGQFTVSKDSPWSVEGRVWVQPPDAPPRKRVRIRVDNAGWAWRWILSDSETRLVLREGTRKSKEEAMDAACNVASTEGWEVVE